MRVIADQLLMQHGRAAHHCAAGVPHHRRHGQAEMHDLVEAADDQQIKIRQAVDAVIQQTNGDAASDPAGRDIDFVSILATLT